jgi:hypothetical protein
MENIKRLSWRWRCRGGHGSCSLVCGRLELGSILSHSSREESLPGRQDPTFVIDTHGAEPVGVLGSRQSAAATPHTGKHLSSLRACGIRGEGQSRDCLLMGRTGVGLHLHADPWDSCRLWPETRVAVV